MNYLLIILIALLPVAGIGAPKLTTTNFSMLPPTAICNIKSGSYPDKARNAQLLAEKKKRGCK